jgi:hypothetical protein
MWASPDRWTCPHPRCAKTVVVHGSDEDVAAAIEAIQARHGDAHRKAAVLDARLRKTNVEKPAPRWGAA